MRARRTAAPVAVAQTGGLVDEGLQVILHDLVEHASCGMAWFVARGGPGASAPRSGRHADLTFPRHSAEPGDSSRQKLLFLRGVRRAPIADSATVRVAFRAARLPHRIAATTERSDRTCLTNEFSAVVNLSRIDTRSMARDSIRDLTLRDADMPAVTPSEVRGDQCLVHTRCAEPRDVDRRLDHAKAEHLAAVRERPLEVRHLQPDIADVGRLG